MDLSYQLINPWPAADFHLAYPGKKYAFLSTQMCRGMQAASQGLVQGMACA